MDNKNNVTISMPDGDGNEIKYRVVLTIKHEATGKKYIIYTDDKPNELGGRQYYAKSYEDIKTEEETKMILSILSVLQQGQ